MRIHRLAVVLLVIAGAGPIQAQGSARFGVMLGTTSAELRDESGGLEPRFGFNAGVFAVLPVRGAVHALVAADYYRKGYEADELRDASNSSLGTDADFQYDYASLVIAPQYAASWGASGLGFYASLGPRLDLLAADRVVATVGGERETVELPEVFGTSRLNSIVFGVSAGVGVSLANVVSLPLLLELRYDADVTSAWNVGDREHRFRTYSLRAGLLF